MKCSRCGSETASAGAVQGICPKCLMALGVETAQGLGRQAGGPPPEPEELARDFPGLEILELVGRGGMGCVYKARQRELDRLVALKILPSEVAADPTFGERFEREARLLGRLQHPSVVSIYDAGRAGGRYYLLMEFVDGVDLRQLIRGGELRSAQALELVKQVCDALQYAHEQGIVHRDVKPENILVDRAGRVKIADFGLAKLLGRDAEPIHLTRSDQAMGTLHYMAPEQMEHPLAVDHRADIYSLGVVFYELLTGELPLGNFAKPSEKVQVDVRLDEVVLKTLAREPERRYQHASDVRVAVESSSAPETGRRCGRRERRAAMAAHAAHAGGGRKRSAWPWVMVGCLLLLLAPVLLFALLIPYTLASRAEALGAVEARRTEVQAAAEQARSAGASVGAPRPAKGLGPVLAFVGGVPVLADAYDESIGIGPEARARWNRVLSDVSREFEAVARRHVAIEEVRQLEPEGVEHVLHVEAFPQERQRLVNELGAATDEPEDGAIRLMLGSAGLLEELLPFGEEERFVVIRLAGGRWYAHERDPRGGSRQSQGPLPLPWRYAHLLQ